MNSQLKIGTRKGLFTVENPAPGQWQIGAPAFLGDPVTMLVTDPFNGDQYAALNLGHFGIKLFRAEQGADNWEQIASPQYPAVEGADGPAVNQIWELTSAGSAGELWAGTIPGGLFKSIDRGHSWSLVTSLWEKPEREFWFGGGYDAAGIHSVCVHPQDKQRLALAISCGGVWESLDGGESWRQIGKGLRAEYMPPEQAYELVSQDPHLMVRCAGSPDSLWIQHHNGIFRSTDGGQNWREIESVKPSGFGFCVAVHPTYPDTAWFVPAIKDERRVPVDAKLIVNRTRDGGKTFEALARGLPEEPAYDLVYRHALAVDAGGDRLAFGSTTGGLWVSEDQGDNWQCLSRNLPPINVVRFDP